MLICLENTVSALPMEPTQTLSGIEIHLREQGAGKTVLRACTLRGSPQKTSVSNEQAGSRYRGMIAQAVLELAL